jgi:hypothetical protein
MAIVVSQQPGAQYNGGDKPTWEIPFNIEGTNDCIEARLALLAASVGIYDGLFRQTPKVEHQGFNFFKGTVIYGKNDNKPENGSIDYQFEIGGKTEKRDQDLDCQRYPEDAPDHLGVINGIKNGDQIDVQGIDVPVPSYSFSLKCKMPASYFTVTRRNQIYMCAVAPVNSVSFYGFDVGEVLFKGATGGLKQGDDFGDIEFKFECSPNMTGLTVGEITGIRKEGWQYAEVARKVAVGSDSLIAKPYAVYVHTLFNKSNFSELLGV